MGLYKQQRKISEEPAFQRTHNYRQLYLNKYHGIFGIYCCAYCGCLLVRSDVTVDHIIPVSKAQEFMTHKEIKTLEKGINNHLNLTAACANCNFRKGNKTGLWTLRGKIGNYLFPALWLLFFSLLPYIIIYTYCFLKCGGLFECLN